MPLSSRSPFVPRAASACSTLWVDLPDDLPRTPLSPRAVPMGPSSWPDVRAIRPGARHEERMVVDDERHARRRRVGAHRLRQRENVRARASPWRGFAARPTPPATMRRAMSGASLAAT